MDVNHEHLNIIHFIFVSCVRFSNRVLDAMLITHCQMDLVRFGSNEGTHNCGGPPTSNLAPTHECTNEGDVDH
jgi:hypothetical protein